MSYPHNIEGSKSPLGDWRTGYTKEGDVVRIAIYGARGPSRYRVTFGQSANNQKLGRSGAYVGQFKTLGDVSKYLETI